MPLLADDAARHPATVLAAHRQHGGELSQRILLIIAIHNTRSRGSSVQVLRSPVGPAAIVVFLPAPARHIAYITPQFWTICCPFPQCI